MPLTVRHLQVVTSHDIEHSLLESVTCHKKTAQTSSSQQCRYAVRWPTPQCVTRNVSRGSEDTSLADREQSAGSAGSKVGNWRCIQTRTGEATRPLGDQSQAGVIMRGGHCPKVWTKKQQVVSLSSAESELYAAVKTALEGLGVQSVAKDLGILCGLNLHLDASTTMGLVNRRGKSVDTEASKSGRFVTKKVGTSVNPADLMTKPLPKPEIEQLMSLMGYEFVKGETGALKGRADGEIRLQLEIFREYLGAFLARLMKGHSAASLGRWLWVTVSSTLRVDVSAVHPGKECIG